MMLVNLFEKQRLDLHVHYVQSRHPDYFGTVGGNLISNHAGPILQSPEIWPPLRTPFVMVPPRMLHPLFPSTEVLVNVAEEISALLILLPVDVEEDSLEFCKVVSVVVEDSTVDDSILDLVHDVELLMWLSLMLQSVIVESEQSEFLTLLLVLVQSLAKLCSTVDRNGFSEQV